MKILISFLMILSIISCNNNSSEKEKDAGRTTDRSDSLKPQTEYKAPESLMASMMQMNEKMKAVTLTGDFDVDFANLMIEHHKSAVEMADIVLRTGADTLIKSMAQKIKASQAVEIMQMKMAVKHLSVSGSKKNTEILMAGMDAMIHNAESGNTDKDFVTMMIRHHEEAVLMAKAELANGSDKKMLAMASKMIKDQQSEISMFKKWLSAHK